MFNTEEVMKLIRGRIKELEYKSEQLSYVSSYHNKLLSLCRTQNDLILFGAGAYGKKVLLDLQDNGLTSIRCFCDNKREGDTVMGLPVVSLEGAKKLYPNGSYVITPGGCENEIFRQLLNAGISGDKIIIYIYTLTGL